MSCAAAAGIAAGLDLSGAPTRLFNISYENLTSRRQNQYQIDLIAGVCCMNGTAYYSCKFFEPYEHGSAKAPLADILLNDELHRDLLTREERELVFTWIDSNGIYYGTWDYTQSGPILTPIEDARRELAALLSEPESGCAQCHGNFARFENDWINIENPESSRVLRAPLAPSDDDPKEIAGLAICRDRKFPQDFLRLGVMSDGRYEHAVKELKMFPTQEWRGPDESGEPVAVFKSRQDETFQRALAIIERARTRALANPRIDMPNADWLGAVREGRSRQILPIPLPEDEIAFNAVATSDGAVELDWERSARTIGLVFKLRRFVENEGENESNDIGDLITVTERFRYVDRDAPEGEVRYELTPISDPARTSAAYRTSAESRVSRRYRMLVGEPISRVVRVESERPAAPTNLRASSEIEQIALSWDEPQRSFARPTRYNVYRTNAESGAVKLLTPEPIYGSTYVDATANPGVDYVYKVVSVSSRQDESEPTSCSGRAVAAKRETLFEAPFSADFSAKVADESSSEEPRIVGSPKIRDERVTLAAGEYLAFPHRAEYNSGRKFTLEFDVTFDEPGEMPVVVGFGRWRQSGWFLQRFNDGWRFHFGGVDCDATEQVPVGKELHIVATFDGEKLQIRQDGKLVGERVAQPALAPWSGELFVGQYSAEQGPQYQFFGSIRNLRILNYIQD
ncbi:MAG: LamG-like jellyroll fold domain-containing protein [Thermoguttaceae bacterium]